MAELDQLPYCCGIQELGYVRDDGSPEEVLMSNSYDDLAAHVVFSVTSSQTPNHKKGKALAAFILANKLGNVVEAPSAKNPNHPGTLKAWIWTPNKTALKRWQAKVRKTKPEQYGRRNGRYDDPYYYGGW